jgi:hypothetical protein
VSPSAAAAPAALLLFANISRGELNMIKAVFSRLRASVLNKDVSPRSGQMQQSAAAARVLVGKSSVSYVYHETNPQTSRQAARQRTRCSQSVKTDRKKRKNKQKNNSERL